MLRFQALLLLSALLFVASSTSALGQGTDEAALRALLQARAEATSRGDLDAVMASTASDIDWMTISGELIEGQEALRAAMRGWIDAFQRANRRITYPSDSIAIQVLSSDFAVADVALVMEDDSHRPVGSERLFYLFERQPRGWVLRKVRNTTP